MEKVLKVVKPFFVMEEGDMMERTSDNTYRSEYNSEYSELNAEDGEMSSTYKSIYEISESYAKALVNEGFLEEMHEKQKDSFVNVFDEITKLAQRYVDELDNLDKDYANLPACLKIEKETVLRNALEILSHLNSLKK